MSSIALLISVLIVQTTVWGFEANAGIASRGQPRGGLPTRTTGYTYNANGSLETVTQPNAVVHTYGYDALNRLRGLIVAQGTTLIHSYEYKLRASGHRRQVVENSAKTTTYSYDDLYRLTDETVSGDTHGNDGAIGYTLDKVGNRAARTSSVASVSSVVNQSFNSRDWLNGDTYTANGSTTVGQVSDLTLRGTDTYDFEEHLILRTKPDGTTINVNYDADGHRVSKAIFDASAQAISSTFWLVDTNNLTGYAQVLEERFSPGPSPLAVSLTARAVVYTYGSALISQAVSLNAQPPTVSYFTYDGHGSTRELTNATGTITDRYDYDAFGILVFRSGATLNAFLYCGEQLDGDLGLYYLRARYLDLDSGRFWSMDDYEGSGSDPRSLHKYLYGNTNPVTFSDPSGHMMTTFLPGVIKQLSVLPKWVAGISKRVGIVAAIRIYYGWAVHQAVYRDYARTMGPANFNRSIAAALDFIVPAKGNMALRPDIVDQARLSVYEIKPSSMLAFTDSPGMSQLSQYLSLLNDPVKNPEGGYTAGVGYPYQGQDVIELEPWWMGNALIMRVQPGLVVYYPDNLTQAIFYFLYAYAAARSYQDIVGGKVGSRIPLPSSVRGPVFFHPLLL